MELLVWQVKTAGIILTAPRQLTSEELDFTRLPFAMVEMDPI
jgi:hypothetical protein